MDMKSLWIAFVFVFAAMLSASAVIYVDDVTDPLEDGTFAHPFDSIQEAVAVASSNDTIQLLGGTYTGSGNRNIDFGGKTLVIQGTNSANTIIDCENTGFAFRVTSGEGAGTAIRNLTIQHAGPTGTIFCANGSSLYLDSCVIQSNAVLNDVSNSVVSTFIGYDDITEKEIYRRVTYSDGSLIVTSIAYDPVTEDEVIRNVTYSNAVSIGATLMCSNANLAVSNCLFRGNRTGIGGGAVTLCRAQATILDSTFLENVAWQTNGWSRITLIAYDPITGDVVFRDEILDIDAYGGGGIVSSNSGLLVSNCTFSGNCAQWSGGAIAANGSDIHILNSTIVKNRAGKLDQWNTLLIIAYHPLTGDEVFRETIQTIQADGTGGGVALIQSTSTLEQVTFRSNISGMSGGGLYGESSEVNLSNVVFSGNGLINQTNSASGSALYLNSCSISYFKGFVCSNVTGDLSQNLVLHDYDENTGEMFYKKTETNTTYKGRGALAFVQSSGVVDRVACFENYSGQNAGAIYVSDGSAITAANMLIYSNYAGFSNQFVQTRVLHTNGLWQTTTVVVAQSAPTGVVIAVTNASLDLIQCTVADNASTGRMSAIHADTGATLTGLNSILWADRMLFAGASTQDVTYCCAPVSISGAGNITTNPLFGASYSLSSISPCIDAGAVSGFPYDLSGLGRPLKGRTNSPALYDMGAYEYLCTNPADSDGDGVNDQDEVAANTNPANRDTDGDRMSDGQEIAAGTDPLDSSSYVGFVQFNQRASGRAIVWKTVAGRGYWVDKSTNLLEGWITLNSSPVTETNESPEGTEMLVDTNAVSDTAFFYRIRQD